MIILLSPSKSMDMSRTAETSTRPEFLDDSNELVEILRDYSVSQIMKFMEVSEKIASLNVQRFSQWKPNYTDRYASPAALAFTGDVYDGLGAESMDDEDYDFMQGHIRILSGLYGLLRPMDLILPYRLEMGRKLQNDRGDNLYDFWKAKLTAKVNETEAETIVNLASNEYFKALDKKSLKGEIITPIFKDMKNGKYKIISFFAKKARGQMARFAVDNRIEDPEKLKLFNVDGYSYNDDLSNDKEWVFTREEQEEF